MKKSAYLAYILLVLLFVGPKIGAAETAENREASAEVAHGEAVEPVQTTSHGPGEGLRRSK